MCLKAHAYLPRLADGTAGRQINIYGIKCLERSITMTGEELIGKLELFSSDCPSGQKAQVRACFAGDSDNAHDWMKDGIVGEQDEDAVFIFLERKG